MLLNIFASSRRNADLRIPWVASVREEGNFCFLVRPQFSSFFVDNAKVTKFQRQILGYSIQIYSFKT